MCLLIQTGMTALMWAVQGGRVEMMRLLVGELNADVSACSYTVADGRGYSKRVEVMMPAYRASAHPLHTLRGRRKCTAG